MTNPGFRIPLLVGAVLATSLLFACSNDSPEKHVASAKTYLTKGDRRAAVIELKSALQLQPDAPDVRFLLGKTLLENEEPVPAAVELRKALGLKQPADTVVPLLAKAMLQAGQQKMLLAEFGSTTLDDKAAQANLKTTLGWAHLTTNQSAQAEAAFKQALDAVPGHVPALVARARVQATKGDRDGAMKALDALVAAGTADADAWALKGDLLVFGRTDADGAVAAYRKAIEQDKGLVGAHAGIIALLLAKRDLKGAADQVTELQKVRPALAMTRLLRAQVAYESRDFKTAKELVAELLKAAPDNPVFNQLAGAIELMSGSPEAARNHLTKALAGAPQSVVARRLLAGVHLGAGESVKALTLLQPLLDLAPPDGVALAMAGEAYLQTGDLDKADALFAKAVQADPTANNQTAVARVRLLKGDALGAVAELQQIAAADPGTTADLVLVNAQLRRRDFKAALAAIDVLERKMDKKPLPSQLRGVAYVGLKDVAQARASFEKALSIEPTFFPAVTGLAALDQQDKKPQAAQQRFETLLKASPGHLQAMLGLAEVRARNGATPQELTELLAEAVRQNPSQPAAHLALVEHQLKNKQTDAALSAAQRAEAALPGNAAVLDALGRAQMVAGQSNQALATFNKLAALKPDNPLALMRLADANLAAKDDDAARQALERAAALKVDSPASLKLFLLQLKSARYEEALALARKMQKTRPELSIGHVLEGDVFQAQKKPDAALAAYKRGLTLGGAGQAAIRAHGLLTASGKAAEAGQFAQTWSKDHPTDLPFALHLGESALARSDWPAAESAFRRAVELQPNHVIALNNLAWVLARGGKPGAVAMAEKATGLQPDQPVLMDTLAYALAADKQVDKAVELQKKVVGMAPDNPTFRLGLARLHVQAGQKAQARELLEALDKMGDKFNGQAEVKRLLTTL